MAPSSVPYLPDELWVLIVRASRMDNRALFGLTRVTRDASYELIRSLHGLNHKQSLAYAAVVYLGRSIFLTGGAGVGKSYTAHKIVDRVCTDLGTTGAVGIVAPTGSAARVASCATVTGQTYHRFFNVRKVQRTLNSRKAVFGREPTEEERLLAALVAEPDDSDVQGLPTAVLDPDCLARLRQLKLLVIDEISMVSRTALEMMSDALQLARNSTAKFGGTALLLCGDFHQFAPVSREATPPYAFTSPLWQGTQTVELTEIVRQGSDAAFATVLGRMRLGLTTPADCHYLNTQSCQTDRAPAYSLYPYHRQVDTANEAAIAQVPGALHIYTPERLVEEMVETSPEIEMQPYAEDNAAHRRVVWPKEPPPLELKLGVPVRCTKNIYNGNVLITANGQRGHVISMLTDRIRVKWAPIGTIPEQTTTVWRARRIKKQTWTSLDGHTVIASVTFFPLALAFASTLHSAQGQTITADVNMEAVFYAPGGATFGSAYVALSRASQLSKVRLLRKLQPWDVRACPVVKAFFQPATPR